MPNPEGDEQGPATLPRYTGMDEKSRRWPMAFALEGRGRREKNKLGVRAK